MMTACIALVSVDNFTIVETLYEQSSFVVRFFDLFKHSDLRSGNLDGPLHDVRDVPTRTILPMNYIGNGNR